MSSFSSTLEQVRFDLGFLGPKMARNRLYCSTVCGSPQTTECYSSIMFSNYGFKGTPHYKMYFLFGPPHIRHFIRIFLPVKHIKNIHSSSNYSHQKVNGD